MEQEPINELTDICNRLRTEPIQDTEGAKLVVKGLKLFEKYVPGAELNPEMKEVKECLVYMMNEYLNGEKSTVYTRREIMLGMTDAMNDEDLK